MNTLAVQRWPGPTPVPRDGLFAILIDISVAPPCAPPPLPGQPRFDTMRADAASSPAAAKAAAAMAPRQQRDAARCQIRLAAREALAAVLDVPVADIGIASSPGTPPRILLAGAESGIGISIAHEDRYSLAAVNLHGAIGADIMRVQDIPDWRIVAHDYLGPATAAALQTATDRPRALAHAWTQREAALKYHAQQLSEWQADLPGVAISLILPAPGLAGHIHIGDKNA